MGCPRAGDGVCRKQRYPKMERVRAQIGVTGLDWRQYHVQNQFTESLCHKSFHIHKNYIVKSKLRIMHMLEYFRLDNFEYDVNICFWIWLIGTVVPVIWLLSFQLGFVRGGRMSLLLWHPKAASSVSLNCPLTGHLRGNSTICSISMNLRKQSLRKKNQGTFQQTCALKQASQASFHSHCRLSTPKLYI